MMKEKKKKKFLKIGLDTSALAPLILTTPFTNSLYQLIWHENRIDKYSFITDMDSIKEAKNIILNQSSQPINKIKEMKNSFNHSLMPLKVQAIKYLSETFFTRKWLLFYSDLIFQIKKKSKERFCDELIKLMEEKIKIYVDILTPKSTCLEISIKNLMPYWGYHKVDPLFINENRKLYVKVEKDPLTIEEFKKEVNISEDLNVNDIRDMYHTHIFSLLNCDEIWAGDQDFDKHRCKCSFCFDGNNFTYKIKILQIQKGYYEKQ